jgi:phage tail sheath protein FI
MSYRHGVYTSEVPTSLLPPVRVEVSMPVVVSTAPVHTLPPDMEKPVNKPVLIYTPAEGAKYFGTLPQGAKKSDYPILQALEIYLTRYRMAPVCVINVFDPAVHVVTAADVEQNTSLVEGTPDVTKVTAADIIGGVDGVTGRRKGLELVDEVFPRFRLIPGQIIAPGFSDNPSVALMLGAKSTGISGHFHCVSIADIPASVRYTEAPAWVQDNNLTDRNLVHFFGSPVFNDEKEIGSIHWAGITAQRDSENEDIPYWSPSNKRLLAYGMAHAGNELMLDPGQAAYLNGNGIVTGLSWIGGMVGWGNRTGAYPGVTDVKDTFIPVRRMFNFVSNTLISTAWQLTDGPLSRRLAGTVCDTFNVWLNGLARREFLLGGRVAFLSTDNPTTDIMDGISRFHVFFTPPSPAREIDFILEYDPTYIQTLFAA